MKSYMPALVNEETSVAQFSVEKLKITFEGESRKKKSWNESQSACWSGKKFYRQGFSSLMDAWKKISIDTTECVLIFKRAVL